MRVIIPTRTQMRKVVKEVNLNSYDVYKGLIYNPRTRQNHPYYSLWIDPSDELFPYFAEKGYVKQ